MATRSDKRSRRVWSLMTFTSMQSPLMIPLLYIICITSASWVYLN